MGRGGAVRRLTMRRVTGALAALLLADAAAAGVACDPGAVDLRGPFGQARFSVELADTPVERAQGLMFRDSLPRGAGMLFVHDAPGRVAFWMKNTLIPLDMIFLDAQGRVTRVHPQAVPGDLTPIDGGGAVFAVLEINGGLAARMGIAPGAEMRHPAFAAHDPAWPCE
ncbi:DUF192 domain-containing protein [Ruixingdingia sedimenti]|uniref:DUF192 domain-containing protein n=1 Tax=Ruixingdingia sedimenti TaxID=3073604 RepID=A0ABU1FDE0_9RHOB|nr:DUF192 domain-containing protein [Xinfangfangia sp. LG-4]MDR5654905.1 DUF192 domain-containing protein [Xinfangfangia sp. LG-4]